MDGMSERGNVIVLGATNRPKASILHCEDQVDLIGKSRLEYLTPRDDMRYLESIQEECHWLKILICKIGV